MMLLSKDICDVLGLGCLDSKITTCFGSSISMHSFYFFSFNSRGADIYAQDSSGFTPMMNAIAHGHKEVIKVLFSFAHSVDVVVKRGKMLLEWAIENGHVSLVEVTIIDCCRHENLFKLEVNMHACTCM